ECSCRPVQTAAGVMIHNPKRRTWTAFRRESEPRSPRTAARLRLMSLIFVPYNSANQAGREAASPPLTHPVHQDNGLAENWGELWGDSYRFCARFVCLARIKKNERDASYSLICNSYF